MAKILPAAFKPMKGASWDVERGLIMKIPDGNATEGQEFLTHTFLNH